MLAVSAVPALAGDSAYYDGNANGDVVYTPNYTNGTSTPRTDSIYEDSFGNLILSTQGLNADGTGTTNSLQGNKVIIDAASGRQPEVARVVGARYSNPDRAILSGNTVEITGALLNEVTGALLYTNGDGETNRNTVFITDSDIGIGTSGGKIYGGYADPAGDNATAVGNKVNVNNSHIGDDAWVVGGHIAETGKSAVASDNEVLISADTIGEDSLILGAYALIGSGDTATTSDNTLQISGSSVIGGGASIMGSYISGTGASAWATGNEVFVIGSTIGASTAGADTFIYGADVTSATNTTMATDNHVNISDSTLNGDDMSLYGGRTGLDDGSPGVNSETNKNEITISDSILNSVGATVIIGGYTYGYGSTGISTAEANTNKVTLDGVTMTAASVEISGGYALAGADGEANYNEVSINDSTLGSDVTIYASNTHGSTGTGTANENKVSISGVTTIGDDATIYSGYARADGASTAYKNTVTISDIAGIGDDAAIYGSFVNSYSGDATAIENEVSVSNSTIGVSASIYGGEVDNRSGVDTTTAAVGKNKVTVADSAIGDYATIYGGYVWGDGTINVTGNEVSISNSTVGSGGDIYGGYAEGDTVTDTVTTNGNTVTIDGATVMDDVSIYGGYAETEVGAAAATGNMVNIDSGTVTKSEIYGGASRADGTSGTATGNIVTISGTSTLTGTDIYGGQAFAYWGGNPNPAMDAFTNNTLNINSSSVAFNSASNFEIINFNTAATADIATLDVTATGGVTRPVQLNTVGDVTFNGAISGTGSLTKIGSGAFTLGAGSIGITGKFTVGAGTFALADNTSVTAGDGMTFLSGSTYKPGQFNLTVNGLVTIDAGAILNLDDVTERLLLSSTTDAIANGGFDSLLYTTELRTGGSGAETELWVTGAKSAGDVVAELTDNGVAVGENGSAGLDLVTSIMQNSTGDLKDALVTQLETVNKMATTGGDPSAASTAFEQIVGSYAGEGIQTTQTVAQNFGGAVFGHLSQMRDSRAAMRDVSLRGNARSLASLSGQGAPANRIWAGGFGVITRQEDVSGTSGYDYNAGGLILGYDRHVGDNATFGFTGAVSRGRVEGNNGFDETDIDTVNLGLYASYDPECGFYAEGNIGYGYTWNEESEYMILGGGSRKGKFETSSFQAGGNVGYAFAFASGLRVIPTAGAQFIRIHQKSYRQTGAIAALPMWRDSTSANFIDIPLSVRINKRFELANGISITPELRASYIIEAKKDTASVRAGFVGSTASMIQRGTDYGRNRGLVGAGIKARLSRNVDAFVDYNLEFRNRYQNHNVMAGVGVSF